MKSRDGVTVVQIGPPVWCVRTWLGLAAAVLVGVTFAAIDSQPEQRGMLAMPLCWIFTCCAAAWFWLSTTRLEFTQDTLRISRRVINVGWSKVWERTQIKQVRLTRLVKQRGVRIENSIRLLLPTHSPASQWVARAIASWANATLLNVKLDPRGKYHRVLEMSQEVFAAEPEATQTDSTRHG